MIAIIPARGGSKGLPHKNMLLLHNKPLIVYTIEAALKSKSIDRVIVSTDDKNIAAIAIEAGAEVPFYRPDYLSSDTASAVDVYIHAVQWVMKHDGTDISKFVVLLPTSPLRTSKDIDAACTLFESKQADTLIAVKETETPPSWICELDQSGKLKNCNFTKVSHMGNRQINKLYYIPCGAIYILDYSVLLNKRTYYTDNTVAYVMPRERATDIDNKMDFEYVEFLMERATNRIKNL
jgi:CMP-N,N'-diacetyllegionaminic acid synthase